MSTTTQHNEPERGATVPAGQLDDATAREILQRQLDESNELAAAMALELRQAADKLTAEPHCGGKYSDCACDYAEQLAALFRDLASGGGGVPAAALDMARRINKAEVAK